MPETQRVKMLKEAGDALLVKHVASAAEIAEAYLFVMKCVSFPFLRRVCVRYSLSFLCRRCGYITGQRIEVDGGYQIQ